MKRNEKRDKISECDGHCLVTSFWNIKYSCLVNFELSRLVK